MTISKRQNIIPLFLAGLYAYFLLADNSLTLGLDEAYYWYWAKNLDWSYYDHPPMIAYIISFFTNLGGDSELFVRLGGWFLMLGAAALNFSTLKTLFPEDKNLPWQAVFIFHLTLLFSAGSLIQTPDSPLIFFWSLAVYSGAKVITEQKSFWWYMGGIALGLGMLSKYTMILIAPCQFLFLIACKEHRHWLQKPAPYLSFLLGILIFSPVIYWNSQHNWISFGFQISHGLVAESQKHPLLDLLRYLGGQMGIMTPLLFIMFAWYSIKGGIVGIKEQNGPLLFLFMLSWPIIIFFGISSMRGELAEGNWPAPAYITGISLMWVMYRSHFSKAKAQRIFAYLSIALAGVVSLLIHIHLHTPFLPIPAQNDPFSQFHSWQNLGQEIDKVIAATPHQEGYIAVAYKGTILAESIFYSQIKEGFDPIKPERYFFLDNPNQRFKGKNGIIIVPKNNQDHFKNLFRPYFEEMTEVATYKHTYRDTEISEYAFTLYLGKNFQGNWAAFEKLGER